jgi:hypothetical protein
MRRLRLKRNYFKEFIHHTAKNKYKPIQIKIDFKALEYPIYFKNNSENKKDIVNNFFQQIYNTNIYDRIKSKRLNYVV